MVSGFLPIKPSFFLALYCADHPFGSGWCGCLGSLHGITMTQSETSTARWGDCLKIRRPFSAYSVFPKQITWKSMFKQGQLFYTSSPSNTARHCRPGNKPKISWFARWGQNCCWWILIALYSAKQAKEWEGKWKIKPQCVGSPQVYMLTMFLYRDTIILK